MRIAPGPDDMRSSLLIPLLVLAACDSDGRGPGWHRAPSKSPHVALRDCALPDGNGPTPPIAKLSGDFGSQEYCWMFGDGTIKMSIEATPGAKLTVGADSQTVPDDGLAQVVIDLDASILPVDVASMLEGGGHVPHQQLAVKLEPPTGAPIDGTIEVDVSDALAERARTMLEGVPKGAPVPRKELANAPEVVQGSMVYLPADPYSKLSAVGKTAPLVGLDLVAKAKDTARHDGGACGPYEGNINAPRTLIDISVDVYDAQTGNPVATHAFTDGHEDCPMFAMSTGGQMDLIESRPDDKVVVAWLEQIAASRNHALVQQ
jgi:hypothetical protein